MRARDIYRAETRDGQRARLAGVEATGTIIGAEFVAARYTGVGGWDRGTLVLRDRREFETEREAIAWVDEVDA